MTLEEKLRIKMKFLMRNFNSLKRRGSKIDVSDMSQLGSLSSSPDRRVKTRKSNRVSQSPGERKNKRSAKTSSKQPPAFSSHGSPRPMSDNNASSLS